MMRPFFTVIVPTHKRPALLREALTSIADQSYSDYQVVVVDDAGDAQTRAVVDEFPRFDYVRSDRPGGGSGARNAGARLARGQWLAFLDDDDVWLPSKLAVLREKIDTATDGVGVVYSALEQFDGATGATIYRTRPAMRGHVLDDILYRNTIGGMSVVVMKREIFEAVGGMDEDFPSLQDMELFVRLAQRTEFEYVDEVLARIRIASHGRITFDGRKKLAGAQMFARRFDGLLESRPRHRRRAAARVFLFALAAGAYGEALRIVPSILAGVLVDHANLRYVAGGIARQIRAAVSQRPADAVNS